MPATHPRNPVSQQWIAELASRLRWFLVRRFPGILAGPFQSPVFLNIYLIVLGIFLIATFLFIPVFWGEFLNRFLTDLWSKYIGIESAKFGVQWITGMPVKLVFLILLVWGLLVRYWARSRHCFLDGIERTAHLEIVRGGGLRFDFLTRMNQVLGSLAPGPTGEILPEYFHFPEYLSMMDKVQEIRHVGYPKGLLISAPTTAGKTRTALELIADLNPPLVIVWPRETTFSSFPDLDKWNGFLVVLADNLAFGAVSEKEVIPTHLHYLLQRCPHALVIATSRQESLGADIRDLLIFTLSEREDQLYYRLRKQSPRQRALLDTRFLFRKCWIGIMDTQAAWWQV
jgi:hypothetical protein